MRGFLEILFAAAVAFVIATPFVIIFDKWKKEMDEDDDDERGDE